MSANLGGKVVWGNVYGLVLSDEKGAITHKLGADFITNNHRASHLHLSSSCPPTQPGSLENAAYLGWFLTTENREHE